MGCIYYFFTWPLYFMYYTLIVMAYTLYYSVIICYHIIMFFIKLIVIIYEISFHNKGQRNYKYNYNTTSKNNNVFTTTNKANESQNTSWQEDVFEKEADLWGLSKEDRRIAKEERMSPADFIEAEERDDDELFTDEWE